MSLLMPGDAEQPGLLVEHRLDLLGRQAERLEQIEDDAGIDGARPRAHAQAVERGEAERAVDALAVLQRAQAGAAAQMRDDDAAVGDLGRDLRQHRGDVLVREAVEAVALHAAAARDRVAAAPARRPRAGRDGSWCRSRRPAARPAGARRRLRSRRGCAAGAAARAAPARADRRRTSGVTTVGPRVTARRRARRDGRRRARGAPP